MVEGEDDGELSLQITFQCSWKLALCNGFLFHLVTFITEYEAEEVCYKLT